MTAIKGDKVRGQYCNPLSLIDNVTEYSDLDRFFSTFALNIIKCQGTQYTLVFFQISLCLGTKLYSLEISFLTSLKKAYLEIGTPFSALLCLSFLIIRHIQSQLGHSIFIHLMHQSTTYLYNLDKYFLKDCLSIEFHPKQS